MDLVRALEYVDPEMRRRVQASVAACAFLSTPEIERLGTFGVAERSAALFNQEGALVPFDALSPGERAVLDRALRVYASHYQVLVGNEKDPRHKADLRNYVEAADRVLKKIRQFAGLPA